MLVYVCAQILLFFYYSSKDIARYGMRFLAKRLYVPSRVLGICFVILFYARGDLYNQHY